MENSVCDVKQLSISLCKMETDYNGYASKLSNTRSPPTVLHFEAWQAPAAGFSKINFEAQVGPGLSRGLGIVIRDARGKILVTGTRKVKANWSVECSETAVALYGLTVARRMGLNKIHLKGDALNVIVALKKKSRGLAPIHVLFDSCFDVLSFFDVATFSFVRRVGNTAVHMVARWETDFNTEKICMPPFPECLRTLEELDLS